MCAEWHLAALEERATDLWEASTDPITLATEPTESAGVLDLVKGENTILVKVVRVFVSLQVEVQALKRKVRHLLLSHVC